MKLHETDTWINNIYWRLDELSCILVTRNSSWFNSVIHQMETLWQTVLTERVSGYDHRAPKKRIKHEPQNLAIESNDIVGVSKCLISNDDLINHEDLD